MKYKNWVVMALLVANWKMNLDVAGASLLLERLKKGINSTKHTIVLCPSAISLYSMHQAVNQQEGPNKFKLGIQNVYYEDEGAFTGEISAYQVRDLVDYAIVGHSERRHVFHESDDEIARKMTAVIRHGITPILCVGETLTEREAGQTNQIILDQLSVALDEVSDEDAHSLVIAYEPVWAIGTGRNAQEHDVVPVFTKIRSYLTTKYSKVVSDKVQLLYGGSVNSHDFASYLALTDCNGLLIGHASLNDADFATIANS